MVASSEPEHTRPLASIARLYRPLRWPDRTRSLSYVSRSHTACVLSHEAE